MSSIAPPAHNRGAHTTDEWITPKWLIDRLGPFDLDPCASDRQPWPCARFCFTKNENGLQAEWNYGPFPAFVYCNPPYGAKTHLWLGKMALHGHGIALVFARTETRMFFRHVWPHASALLFLRGRLVFCRPDGEPSKVGHNSGGPSVLIAYGEMARIRLEKCADLGALVVVKRSMI
jgi:hypothetical protein